MEQHLESQKRLIARFVVERKWVIDEWIEVTDARQKFLPENQLKREELPNYQTKFPTVIVSELFRVGHSIKEVFEIIEESIKVKQCRLILVKQGLDLDPSNKNDMTNKILLTIFSMMAELERDFISERTKEGLRARKEQGIILGKPKGTIQKSMYDPDRERIEELFRLGVSINTIIKTHLKYGNYLSLKYYIDKRIPKTNGQKIVD